MRLHGLPLRGPGAAGAACDAAVAAIAALTAIGVLGGYKGHTDPTNILVALATAHPAKFPATVNEATGVTPHLPGYLSDLFEREENFDVLPNNIDDVRNYITKILERSKSR